MQFSAFDAYAAAVGLSSVVTPETQNSDYESGTVQLGRELWLIRTARVTPTKQGAFVAFWQRDSSGKTVPFTHEDPAAGLLVFVTQHDHRGVFRFTRGDLTELGITSGKGTGKRGFRVYPRWCRGLNPQATATQRAQAPAFQEF